MDSFEIIDVENEFGKNNDDKINLLIRQIDESKQLVLSNIKKNIDINITIDLKSHMSKSETDYKCQHADDEKHHQLCKVVHDKVAKIKRTHVALQEDAIVDLSNVKSVKITQKLINDTYQKFKVLINNKKFNFQSSADMALFTMYALQLANELVIVGKQYRIELALSVLRKYISENVKSPDAEIANVLIETAVPRLIDTLETTLTSLPALFSKWGCCKR